MALLETIKINAYQLFVSPVGFIFVGETNNITFTYHTMPQINDSQAPLAE